MSTKTSIQSLINSNLADNSAILASEHRAVENSLLNELYGTIIQETYSGITDIRTNTEPTSDDNFYNLRFVKQGRKVTVIGSLINKQTTISSGTKFFKIINSEFYQATDMQIIHKMNGISENDQRNIFLSFNTDNELICSTSLGIGENINIEITYFTEN